SPPPNRGRVRVGVRITASSEPTKDNAMSVQIVVPALGESVTEATVSKWMKNVGDVVKADEPLLELETDKVTQEVYAPTAGTLGTINAEAGAVVPIGAVLGVISEGGAAAA